jgi:hypothetical protein
MEFGRFLFGQSMGSQTLRDKSTVKIKFTFFQIFIWFFTSPHLNKLKTEKLVKIQRYINNWANLLTFALLQHLEFSILTFHTLAVFDRRIDLNLEENRLIGLLLLCVHQSSSLQLRLVNYAAAARVADCNDDGDSSRVSKTQTTTSQLGQHPLVLLYARR